MKHNTAVSFAYSLLAKGVHLREIQRFADASPSVDPVAETIPAPPFSGEDAVLTEELPCGEPSIRESRLVPFVAPAADGAACA